MYCRTCGSKMNDNAEMCVKCGVRKNVGTEFCQVCGRKTTQDTKLCPNCGAKLLSAKSSNEIKEKAVQTVSSAKRVFGIALLVVGIMLLIWGVYQALIIKKNEVPYAKEKSLQAFLASVAIGLIFVIVGAILKKKKK